MGIRNVGIYLRNSARSYVQKQRLKSLASASEKKIVIGSAGTGFSGWVSTDQQTLDLLDAGTWARRFSAGTLDAILAEHVWEHLWPDAAMIAAKNCFTFLKPGGYLRVAVPDGFHPDPAYVDAVRPGGHGAGSDDHKVLYTYKTFREVFESIGFEIRLYEYFNEDREFCFVEWDAAGGLISRSSRLDARNKNGKLAYTSIILDAVKPVGLN